MTKRLGTALRLLLVTAVLAVVIGPATIARGGTQDFVLVNRTSVEIHELYISSADTDDWEEDVLGVDNAGPGRERQDLVQGPQGVQVGPDGEGRGRRFDRVVRPRPLLDLESHAPSEGQEGNGRPGIGNSTGALPVPGHP